MKSQGVGILGFSASHLPTANSCFECELEDLTTQPSPSITDSCPIVVHILVHNMAFTDILSLILSFAVVFSLRFLFPRNIVPLVSTSFEEAVTLLEHADAINISYVSEYRANLAMYACLYSLTVSSQLT